MDHFTGWIDLGQLITRLLANSNAARSNATSIVEGV
jgi:hypothetical protein